MRECLAKAFAAVRLDRENTLMIQGITAPIYVSDMNRAVEFYSETLGLPPAGRWGDEYAGIDLGKGLAIGLHPARGPHSPKPGSNSSIQVGFAEDEPLDDVVQNLQSRRVVFHGPIVDDVQVRLAFFSDPDGNALHLTEVKGRDVLYSTLGSGDGHLSWNASTFIRPRSVFVSTEDQVRRTSQRFNAALNRMADDNPDSMADVWSHRPAVPTMHPAGCRQVGYAVKRSWQHVAHLALSAEIKMRAEHHQVSSAMACEVGTRQSGFALAGEDVSVEVRVTKADRREGGGWRMAHHHTDLYPAVRVILSRLQS